MVLFFYSFLKILVMNHWVDFMILMKCDLQLDFQSIGKYYIQALNGLENHWKEETNFSLCFQELGGQEALHLYGPHLSNATWVSH